jgi:hypothetical protein
MRAERLRVVVSGMLAGVPDQGGATWAVLQYILGLRDLGHDVLFVEQVDAAALDDPRVGAYFADVADRFDLWGHAGLIADGTDRTIGLDRSHLATWTKTADLLLNLSGNLDDDDLLGAVPRRVYVDLDPAFTQLWETASGIDMGLDGHDRFVTVGLAVGSDGCAVPTCGRSWTPTLPPVVLDQWPVAEGIVHDAFTTVANGRGYGSIEHEGTHYGQKLHSLREIVGLPARNGAAYVLALAIGEGDDRDRHALDEHGWDLVAADRFPRSPDDYHAFVRGSRAEIGIAKSGYVRSRCGWFSDRSACYLASGRPVVAQDTGFSAFLPCGDGLFAFDDTESAAAAVAEINTDYEGHRRAARAIAGEHLDSRVVLTSLLERVGGTT